MELGRCRAGEWRLPASLHCIRLTRPLSLTAPQITFYDPVRSTFELSSRLTCPGTMGPPQCLAELQREAEAPPGLLWGDTGESSCGRGLAGLRGAGAHCLPPTHSTPTTPPLPAEGAVMLLKCEPPPLHSDRPLAPRKDFEASFVRHGQLDSLTLHCSCERMAPRPSWHILSCLALVLSLNRAGAAQRPLRLGHPRGAHRR